MQENAGQFGKLNIFLLEKGRNATRPPQVTLSLGIPLYKGTVVGYLLYEDLTQRYPRPNPVF